MFPTVMFPRSMFAQLDWWDAASVSRPIVYHLSAKVAIAATEIEITTAKVTPR